jgi:hypothetical protein
MNSAVDLSIFESELRRLEQLVLASPDVETGGELLGLWTNGGGATVMLVTGPAPNARREYTSFAQPPDVHMAIEQFVWANFGLQVLGIWHSHHRLGMHILSQGDLARTQGYARRHSRRSYAEILGYIDGFQTDRAGLRPFVYADAGSLTEVPSVLRPLPGMSPIRRRLLSMEPPPILAQCLQLPPVREPQPEVRQPEVIAPSRAGEEVIMHSLERALERMPDSFTRTVSMDVHRSSITMQCCDGDECRVIEISSVDPRHIRLTSTEAGRRVIREMRTDDRYELPDLYLRMLRSVRKNMAAQRRRRSNWLMRVGR